MGDSADIMGMHLPSFHFRPSHLALMLAGIVALPALAQDDPPLIEPEGMDRIEQVPGAVGRPAPRIELDPRIVGPAPHADAPTAMREGEFILNRSGQVLRGQDGRWVFVADALDNQPDLPPLVVQPSRELETIAAFIDQRVDGSQQGRFTLAGQVHRYRGLHYLIPTRVQPAAELEPDEPDQSDEPMDERDVLEQLLEQREPAPDVRDARPAPEDRRMANAVAGTAPDEFADELRREGELLFDRRGRLVRSPDGGHVLLAFQGDGRESPEAPMVVMPNQLRHRMEQIVQDRGQQVSFYVSGQVYTYAGANHLLITSMRLTPDAGNLR